MPRIGVPSDVAAIRTSLASALNTLCSNGMKVGDAKFGAYAFYDYDGEPIYVGQTSERLRVRVRRHLTNHRTDAVAMNVLDPFEVFEIELWPLWEFQDMTPSDAAASLNAIEYSVFQRLLRASSFNAVLNEKDMVQTEIISELPASIRICIVPEELWEIRKHPDVRLARRAATIASLAKVISERDVSPGLRRTLRTQAQRLERLSSERFAEFSSDPIENESSG
jgi:hypothetical protein